MTLIVTDKHLSRRTLLKGTGAAIALPMLNAMQSAVASPANRSPVYCVAVVYVPNGIIMKDWVPGETGTDFTFPRILKPLEPFRRDITVISGLANTAAIQAKGGAHAKASGSLLPEPVRIELDLQILHDVSFGRHHLTVYHSRRDPVAGL